MPFSLTTISVTGSFYNAAGTGLSGSVTFTPTAALTDASAKLIMSDTPIIAAVTSGTMTPQTLATTDNAGLIPAGWQYAIGVAIPGASTVFNTYLPSTVGTAGTVDISLLQPSTAVITPSGSYVQSLNGYTGQVSISFANGTLTVGPTL
jgi:hypothetical protein